jgi:hypothetical protein
MRATTFNEGMRWAGEGIENVGLLRVARQAAIDTGQIADTDYWRGVFTAIALHAAELDGMPS